MIIENETGIAGSDMEVTEKSDIALVIGMVLELENNHLMTHGENDRITLVRRSEYTSPWALQNRMRTLPVKRYRN